ncbi:toxin-antitoxin system YwqK family antitoxin [Pontibacter brevis]
MRHSVLLALTFVTGLGLLTLGGCGQPKWNSDYNLNQARLKGGTKIDSALASADTINPDVEVRKALEREDVEEGNKKKKKKKQSKRYFLGYKVKRGFIKSGRGSRETLETFSYLPEHEAPNPYAPAKYLYDTKKRKLYRTSSNEVDQSRYKVLHGPYVKKIDGQTVEEGYFYVGTKHLRWEKYRPDEEGTLVGKEHYEKGFVRDAVVTYYDSNQEKIKEVIPYAYGEVQGTYYRFYENGQVQWSGQYEKGRKIGTWIHYYDFRGRRHHEFQYPKTVYDQRFEPYLVKEYDRHGTLIFEKDKLDRRSQAQR